MFGINDALRERAATSGPIRVAVIGTGAMGGPMVQQTITAPGMDVVLVVDIDPGRAEAALATAGVGDSAVVCDTATQVSDAVAAGRRAVSSDPSLAWTTAEIDVVVEATGNPFVYADIAFHTIMAKKHLVTFNVEGDVVVGNLLKRLADNAGVVYTGVAGDEPGVVKALYDEADALGFEILAAGRSEYGGGELRWHRGNAHEYLERFAVSAIQKNMGLFASFIDGSKTNEECAMIANATGLEPDVRGMHGPTVTFDDFVREVPRLLDSTDRGGILSRTGVVERIVPGEGPDAQPVWCFVVVRIVNELQRVFMGDMAGLGNLAAGGKLLVDGERATAGLFYTPYHYVAVQAPISVAQAVINGRATIAPRTDRRFADVVALTKKDLRAGDVLDGIGGECVAGRVEKARVFADQGLLPYALAAGATLTRDLPAGTAVGYADVELADPDAMLVKLRRLQDGLIPPA